MKTNKKATIKQQLAAVKDASHSILEKGGMTEEAMMQNKAKKAGYDTGMKLKKAMVMKRLKSKKKDY